MAQFFSRVSFGSDSEAATYNRAAWKLIPFLLILYIISFLDRVNVGFAANQAQAVTAAVRVECGNAVDQAQLVGGR